MVIVEKNEEGALIRLDAEELECFTAFLEEFDHDTATRAVDGLRAVAELLEKQTTLLDGYRRAFGIPPKCDFPGECVDPNHCTEIGHCDIPF